ncbi:MAG: cation:proton antiporter [Anaerolineae bacterium]|nr:cation:proton antiporter [Anaerolineae bacterium]
MEHNAFLPLLLITGLAVAVPIALNRFRWIQLPIVVGEILAGIIIGRSGFDIVPPSLTLDFLAEFGFAFLMFLSGLEVDVSILTVSVDRGSKGKRWIRPLPMGVLIFLTTLLLAFLAALALNQAGLIESPFLMALILSTTSLGIVAPVLKERGLMGSDYGQTLLVTASIADFVTLLLLTVVVAIRSRGLTVDLLLIPLMLLLFILVARVAQVFSGFTWLRRVIEELSPATGQIQIRGAFALMVAWVVVAEALGVELILGAFLAGTIIGLVAGREQSEAREKLDAIGFGFFIPIFFITVGVNFDLSALAGSDQALLLVPLLIGIAYLVKVVAAFIFRLRFSWAETLAGGFLLSSRLSLIIAAAAIALEIGAISQSVQSAIVLVAIVTCTVSPLLFNRLYRGSGAQRRHGVILVGDDQMTGVLARRLHAMEHELAVISSNQPLIEQLSHAGLQALSGAPVDEDLLRQAGADRAGAIVVLVKDGETAVQVCQLAKNHFYIPHLVALVSGVESLLSLQTLGVRVVQPTLATAIALEGALRFPTTFDVLTRQASDVEVRELVLNNRTLVNIPVRQIRLPGNVLILSITRDSLVMVPHGETVMQIGDRVALIGSPQSVEEVAILLEDLPL